MKLRTMLFGAAIFIVAMFAVRAQDLGNAEAERYIKESERQWAKSVATGDSSAVERILAEDFVGVDPDGSLYGKAKMVKDTASAPRYFLSNHLNEVKVRFYGEAAVAQGNESWVRKSGTPLH